MIFNLIEKAEDLEFLNQELVCRPYVGVDTEFRRTTKDNMKLSLIQVNDSEEIYLIDCLQIEYIEDICDFLFSNKVIKILHSCKEDYEAINSWTGRNLVNVFDTQLANAFLGGSYSIGYQDLVIEKIDIKVDKDETRSNWLRRPLSDSQLRYAASDVEFLSHLFIDLEEKLREEEKLDWFKEEILTIASHNHINEDKKNSRQNLTKQNQKDFLYDFNYLVEELSEENNINKTLFFSKKLQKLFLLEILSSDLKSALNTLTLWRKKLLMKPLDNLINLYKLN